MHRLSAISVIILTQFEVIECLTCKRIEILLNFTIYMHPAYHPFQKVVILSSVACFYVSVAMYHEV